MYWSTALPQEKDLVRRLAMEGDPYVVSVNGVDGRPLFHYHPVGVIIKVVK